jgi:hypothetical protein
MKIILKDDFYEIDEKIWEQYSILIKNILNDYKDCKELEAKNFEFKYLVLLDKILFIKNKNNFNFSIIPKPMNVNFNFEDYVNEYENNFFQYFDLDWNKNAINDLLNFIKIVNFFDVPELFELACAKMAELCRNINKDEFKKIFLIK